MSTDRLARVSVLVATASLALLLPRPQLLREHAEDLGDASALVFRLHADGRAGSGGGVRAFRALLLVDARQRFRESSLGFARLGLSNLLMLRQPMHLGSGLDRHSGTLVRQISHAEDLGSWRGERVL